MAGCKPDGISSEPLLTITTEALDFGDVPIGTTLPLTFSIVNGGSSDFEVLSVSIIEGRTAVWSVSGENSVELLSGESLEVEVVFAPYEMTVEEGRIQVRTTFEDEPSRYVSLLGVGGLSIADNDGDGFSPADGDCDDDRSTVYPGAEELCDGRDNDCDSNTDEANTPDCTTYYRDYDGDGYGDSSYSVCTCSTSGYYSATNSSDCYDYSSSANPGQSSYFTSSRGDGSYDYNCDGSQTKRYTTTYSCSAGFTGCTSSTSGWGSSAPSCGNTGTWESGCIGAIYLCTNSSSSSRTQSCR